VQIEQREGCSRLKAMVSGEQIDAGRHCLLVDVKAVTLHRFQVAFADNIWQAVVVLDV
jgi:SHS2 domain-containing protein